MERKQQGNETPITEFILLGFGNTSHLQIFLFLLFLVTYIVTMAGNIIIVVIVLADQNLHSPMYFFLGNLSFLETCYSCTLLPRLLVSLLTWDRSISVSGCLTQLYFFGSLLTTECSLLCVMAYDRYLAILKPLHYAVILNEKFCRQLVAWSWISGFASVAIILFMMLQLKFCGPKEIDHFFCDFSPLLKLSCSDTCMVKVTASLHSCIFTLPLFLLTVSSYVCIISTILKIPSTTGRQKAFSTCSSHLTVVTIFYGALVTVYLLSGSEAPKDLNKVFSVVYGALTPLANPLIYSLKNKAVKEALKKAVLGVFVFDKSTDISR
ncbi:olfactory receptor 5AP2-like [Carettochelys insculpta]|uniref:olfactory receptor 5AP2-like n=1 Tax=Carettochelys insculpta TaxID=44489 RepID=UPI003EBB748E